jgi:hypothetical protein
VYEAFSFLSKKVLSLLFVPSLHDFFQTHANYHTHEIMNMSLSVGYVRIHAV